MQPNFMQILQDRISQLGNRPKRPSGIMDASRQDIGRMLMAFGAGAAGSRGSFLDALSGGAGGLANHVQGLHAQYANDDRRRDDELFDLQSKLFSLETDRMRSKRQAERDAIRDARDARREEKADRRYEENWKYKVDKDTNTRIDRLTGDILERNLNLSPDQAYARAVKMLSARRAGGNVPRLGENSIVPTLGR